MQEKFFEKLRAESKSELTIRQYRSSLQRFARWFEEGPTQGDGVCVELELALQADVANFKRSMTNTYKPNTARQTLSHLRCFYNFLIAQGEIPDNPVTHIDPVQTGKQVPKWLTRNEQNTLIRFVRKHGDVRELAIITFMLFTGVRVQELCDIKLTDIELSERRGKVIIRRGKH